MSPTYRTILHEDGTLEKVENGAKPTTTATIPATVDLSTLTDDDLRREAKESLVLMMRGAKGDLKALGAVRELLDRIEGKPIARTEASLDVRSVSLEVKAYNARNELLDKILKSGNK